MAAPQIILASPPAVIGRWRTALAAVFASLLVMSGMASTAWASSDCHPIDGTAPGAEACEPCGPLSGESPVDTATEAAADTVCDPCDASAADTDATSDVADADTEPCPAPQEVTPPAEPVAEAIVPALPTTPPPSSGPDIPRLPEPAPAAPANPNPAPAPNPAAPTTRTSPTPTPTGPTAATTPTPSTRTPSPSTDVGVESGTPSLPEAPDDVFEFGPSQNARPLVLPGPPTDSGAPPGTSLDDGFAGFDQEDVADLTDVPSPDVAGADRDLAFEPRGGRDDRGVLEPRTAPPATDDAGGGDAIPVDQDQSAPALLLLLGVVATGLLAATTREPAPRTAPEVSPRPRLGLRRRRPRAPKPG